MLGTQAELTRSPRTHEGAERLALRTTDALVAPEARYQRILADLTAIEAAVPGLAGSRVFASFGTHAIFLQLTPAVSKAVAAGTYRGFDCLHAWYGAKRLSPMTGIDMVIVYFTAPSIPFHF